MKITVYIIVLNEEDTIEPLVRSLLVQTKKANEILIIDGGSKDRTVRIIKEFQKKHKSIRFIVSPGPVAYGRNVGVKHAKYEIVASIDAGCIAKKDWLEKLTMPFINLSKSCVSGVNSGSLSETTKNGITGGRKVDVVAGFYQMKWKNSFQRAMTLYRGIVPERYDPKTFIPSGRSVAFRKKVWRELGGFNEDLALSGEDTQFFYNALQKGYNMVRVKDALVEWKEPAQFGFRDFKKFFYYARGDAQTGIWWDPIKKWRTHNIKILTIYFRYTILLTLLYLSFNVSKFFFLAFIFLFFPYVLWSIAKWRDVVKNWETRLWIPIIQIVSDAMVMMGFLAGMLSKL